MRLVLIAAAGILAACRSGASWPLEDDKIVGGKDTEIEEVPYQVTIEFNSVAFCGGTIISDRYILTAAHCFQRLRTTSLRVRTGSSFTGKGGVSHKVKKLFLSPKFRPGIPDYDVGIIELMEPIIFNNKSLPAKLPNVEPKGGEMAKVSGWGLLSEAGQRPTMLQSVVVPVGTREECEKMYGPVEFTLRMICIGAAGLDSCQGDSGGPAAYNGEVIGIVSWGYGCGRPDYYGVYTNVANPEIRSFIREVTGL